MSDREVMTLEDWRSLSIFVLKEYDKAFDILLERLEQILAVYDPDVDERRQLKKLRGKLKPIFNEVSPEFYALFSKDLNEL